LLDAIASGRIHLSSVLTLRDLFAEGNIDELVDAAAGRSKREVEELVAKMAPTPPVPPSIRLVPEQRPLPSAPSPDLPPPVAVDRPARADAKVSPLSRGALQARAYDRRPHPRASGTCALADASSEPSRRHGHAP